MQALINLKIYDQHDEVIEEFSEKRLRWGLVEDVVELSENLEGKSDKEAYVAMGKFIQCVFPTLSDELLRLADVNDVKRCFEQIVSLVKQIGPSQEKKQD